MGALADLIDAWADVVYGSACVGCGAPGRPWCRSCAQALGQGIEPQHLDLAGIPGACVGEYEGWLQEMVIAHKERSAWALAQPLGDLLAQAVHAITGQWSSDTAICLCPIPSRASTVRGRGHDPAARMVARAATHLRSRGVDAFALPLLRVRFPVQDSVGLTSAARHRNLQDAFGVKPGMRRRLAAKGGILRIVVCDDVMTTGTTMAEARSALALAGLPASGVATVAVVR